MNKLIKVRRCLKQLKTRSQERAALFFKTQKGGYAEHDLFMGVTVPNLRKVAQEFSTLSFKALKILLYSKFNEERFLALIVLVDQFRSDPVHRKAICDFYLKHRQQVNNWNLVDVSAHWILGAYLWDKNRRILLTLARSDILWDRRIAVVSTWYFIRHDDVAWTFKIVKMLLKDSHDLIHKASGWMLREAGKRKKKSLLTFLDEHAHEMPRTMLRYAIEKLSEKERKHKMQITQQSHAE
jgi:3-methyladenine DNA glycosylase AlkD